MSASATPDPKPKTLGRDLVAGLVVFLVALPLCLGIALASRAKGVPVEANVPLFAGVLAGITTLIGALQSTMALQILAGRAAQVPRQITTADVWTGALRTVRQPPRDPECRVCARREFAHLDGRHRAPISLCGRNAVQIHERQRPVDLAALARTLAPLGQVRANEFALRFFIDAYELTVFPDGRAIIKGTQDTGVARSLYARYIGA